ncbi:uncharacterized protein LOC127749046 [Frankliniella occidentalis]|uniref:Uncharacterized protein LOC127749046 n=1 Tax=Frankliniella occidentalis TaxID=133901 RepID=A0A9C6TSC3_FRAOC|nr:uncharacterized protein LOC127749046 [Frankliniella occidentalis]
MVWGQDYEASSSATHTLVGDFFSAREVPFVLLFPCSHREAVLLVRALQSGTRPVRGGVGRVQDGAEGLAESGGPARTGIYVNLACEEGQLAVQRKIAGSVTWLALGSTEPELDLAVDSDFTLASELAGGEVELRSLFKAGDECPPRSLVVGRWRPDDGLRLSPRGREGRDRAATLRGDLCGAVLPAAVVLHQIAVGDDQAALRRALVDHTNTHMDTETRFGFALATHLAEMYNFTLRLLVTPSWGYPRGNGTFDGMIGMLQRGEIDLGVTPAVITKERLAVADFTVQTWTLR